MFQDFFWIPGTVGALQGGREAADDQFFFDLKNNEIVYMPDVYQFSIGKRRKRKTNRKNLEQHGKHVNPLTWRVNSMG